MKLHVVDTGHLHSVWSQIEQFIASALEYSKGDYTVEAAKTLLATGQWMLIVAVDEEKIHGAATAHLFNRPHDRVAFITAIGGKLISTPDTVEQLKQLFASYGATCIEGAARESIARLWSRYGFDEKYRIVGVKI